MTQMQNKDGIEVEMTAEEIAALDQALAAVANTPSPVDAVSARQFKLQLLSAGLLDQVDAWVSGQGKAVQIAFEYSSMFVRTEPMMASGFTAMGFTEEQIDEFFLAASHL